MSRDALRYDRFLSLFRHELHFLGPGGPAWADVAKAQPEAAAALDKASLANNASSLMAWAAVKLERAEALLDTTTRRRRRDARRKCRGEGARRSRDVALAFACLNDDCHSLPQIASVFYEDGTRACTHVARYDRLTADLRALELAYVCRVDTPKDGVAATPQLGRG